MDPQAISRVRARGKSGQVPNEDVKFVPVGLYTTTPQWILARIKRTQLLQLIAKCLSCSPLDPIAGHVQMAQKICEMLLVLNHQNFMKKGQCP